MCRPRPGAAPADRATSASPKAWTDGICGAASCAVPRPRPGRTTTPGPPPDRTAVLAAAVPQPHGFADLRQAVLADRYRSRNATFRAQVRSTGTGQAAVYLRTVTEQTAHTSTDNRILTMIG